MVRQNLEERIARLEKRARILEELAEISTTLNSRVQIEPLLSHIMEVAVDITDCGAASVILWNNNSQQLFFAASTSDTATKLIGTNVPMDSIAGRVLRENRIITVNNAQNDPRHSDKVDKRIEFETRSLLAVPMTYKDQVIGVVQTLNKKELPWTDDDEYYLGILAAQAAVAIEGAQLVIELRKANDELQESDKLKNNFIAIASHELRTPLGVIMGYASFLQEETSEEAQDHASKVLESALKLRQIIEDMVNLRYLKQHESDMTRQQIKVQELLAGIERDTLTMIDIQHHELNVAKPDHDCNVTVDQERLSMAITNLVNNAVSFTPPGGKITIQADKKDEEVWISVTDTGIGLDEDQLQRIFVEFYQVEDHMIRHHGGLGIGLSITQSIIKAHGGRIWASSPGKDQGTTFTFSLPITR